MTGLQRYLRVVPPVMMFIACAGDHSAPTKETLAGLHLKKGNIILCGPAEKEFGVVDFAIGGSPPVKADFNTAVELLHSFEYDEAEKAFAKIIDEAPQTAMAYWGVAMCNFHPLWEPPTEADLIKGSTAITLAASLRPGSKPETAFIDAAAAYYKDWKTTDPHARAMHFEGAMEQLYQRYPDNKEAAIFYALALDAAALPTDKTYARQKKAGAILTGLYPAFPDHPGIIHYIIHTYDYPGIASIALPAAKRYASVAPSSAHALHMPSHIFTRLGLWDESIQSNLRSVDAAKCYARQTGIKGHWDEEMHGLDYLVYAYLQEGNDSAAKVQLDYLTTITDVSPLNGKDAYTFAAAPCRMALENKDWREAARLSGKPDAFPWEKFPWQEAIIHFGKLLGSVHIGEIHAAEMQLLRLGALQSTLLDQKDAYKARQVEIQKTAGQAWIAHARGANGEAVQLMKKAADWEDSTSKHPVTPGEVLPARELYADLLLDLRQYAPAYQQYLAVLEKSPNRFNALFGAAQSAQLLGDSAGAGKYYKQLLAVADPRSSRVELNTARGFVQRNLARR